MNDDVKAAVDLWRREMADGDPDWWERERLILAHIDGEPARIAAACEEVREACAQRVPSIGQPHDCFEAVRATPLTATPLADALARAEEGVRYWTDLAQAEARDAAASVAASNETVVKLAQAATEAHDRAEKAEAERDSLRARRCDAYSLLRPEFDGVTFCRKDGARAAQDVLDERDALRAKVFEVEQRQVGYVLVSFASHEQWKAELAELGALRARLDALYGVILFAHAFTEAEPLVSGYVRLHGHILHLREIHALARVAADVLAAMDEAKP